MKQNLSYRNIFRIALPIVASSVAQNIIIVADTAFLGRVGKVELGAAGNAGILYFLFVFMCMGLATGAQIIVGRRNGESAFHKIGPVMDRLFVLLAGFAVLVAALLWLVAPAVMPNITASPDIAAAANEYLSLRNLGIVFALFNFGMNAFFVGTTRTFILMPATALMAVVNVVLDYGLIFGNLGLPEMGIAGAGLASAIAEASASLLIIGYIIRKVDVRKYQLFRFTKLQAASFVPILRIGSPVMLQNGLSLLAWFIFFAIVEHMGSDELAVSHIIRSIYSVMMIPMWGFSHATNTLVSNLIGQKQPELVRKAVWRIMSLTMLASLPFIPINLLWPEQIIQLFTTNATLVEMSVPTLWMITATLFVLGVGYIQFSGVSGTGNTRTALLMEIGSILVYLLFAWYIATQTNVPVSTVWSAEFVYFGAMGLSSFLYLRYGRWHTAQV